MTRAFEREEVLDKKFDYKRCTKIQLRQIMSMLNIDEIPSLYVKKDELLQFYREHVYSKIDELKNGGIYNSKINATQESNFSNANDFQTPPPTRTRRNSATPQKEEVQSPSKTLAQKSITKEEVKKAPAKTPIEKTAPVQKVVPRPKTVPTTNPLEKSVSEKLKTARKSKRWTRCKRITKIFFLAIFISLIVYLKWFIPYCEGNLRYCVPAPKNSQLVDGKLFCNKGYRKVTSFIDYCTYDTRIEYNNKKKARSIIRTLEKARGEYSYGLRDTPKIKTREISVDEDVLEILRKSDLLVFSGNQVEALNQYVTFKLRVKYHLKRGIMGIISLIATILFVKIIYSGRKKATIYRQEAEAMSKDVLKSLNKQAVIALKTDSISSTVFSTQLQESFEAKSEVWIYVEDILKKHSNVEATIDETGELKFRWVGLMFYNNRSSEDFLNRT